MMKIRKEKIHNILDLNQSMEQAGFRIKCSTINHVQICAYTQSIKF